MEASSLAKLIDAENRGIQATIEFIRETPGDVVWMIHDESFEGEFRTLSVLEHHSSATSLPALASTRGVPATHSVPSHSGGSCNEMIVSCIWPCSCGDECLRACSEGEYGSPFRGLVEQTSKFPNSKVPIHRTISIQSGLCANCLPAEVAQ